MNQAQKTNKPDAADLVALVGVIMMGAGIAYEYGQGPLVIFVGVIILLIGVCWAK